MHYDIHGIYLGDVQIIKFIKHYHRINKLPYVCVRIKFLDGTKYNFLTFNAIDVLGNIFTNIDKSEKILEKLLTKNRE